MTNRSTGSRPVATGNPDLIREDIERTRDDLGDTMQALAGKADVKSRTRGAAERAKAQARQKADRARARAREKVTMGAHRMQHQSEDLKQKATEGAQRARRRAAPIAATAASAAAAAGTIIYLRRRRMAKAQARQRLRRLWR